MGKLLVLTSCCFLIAASQSTYPEHLETNLLLFKDEPKAGHVEAFQDHYVKQIFAKLLRRRLPNFEETEPIKVENPILDDIEQQPATAGSAPEVMLLHSQLQNKLGWGSDNGDRNQPQIIVLNNPPMGFHNQGNGGNRQLSQSYGGPPPPPPQNYGPPRDNNQAYGPPPRQNNQQYGPPPQQNNQQFGPPPQQNFGPPVPVRQNNQEYGPPQQNYGPPAPVRQNNQEYGPPPPQNYGPPAPIRQNNQEYGPPPQQNYGPPAPVRQNNQEYGPPPPQNYGPPAPIRQNNQGNGPPPQQNYGPPAPVRQNNQEYGGPPPPPPGNFIQNAPVQPNQGYGPPQGNAGGNQGGYEAQNEIRVNQGNFGGYIENLKQNKGSLNQQAAALGQFSNNGNGLNDGPKIFKHVYIHTPTPDAEEPPQKPRVIKLGKKPDTHYQIVFVKAPTPPQMPPTEIELPAAPERKTLVYVLVKKPQKPAEIKFRAPSPTNPPKPEVYFIKYKGNGQPGEDEAQQLLSQVGGNGVPDSIRNAPNEGYSNDVSYQPQFLNEMRPIVEDVAKLRESAGYPNTEYRATPSMLNPNQEPMSIAVYDRVRNGIPAAATTGTSDRAASSSNNRGQQGSHYTAPGSEPFMTASGRMVNGQYIGMTSMTSNSLSNQYYSQDK